MSLKLYMDVHVAYAINVGLRLRGVDVLTAQEDSTTTLPDPDLLDHSSVFVELPILMTKDHRMY